MKKLYNFINVKSPMDELIFNKVSGIVVYILFTILGVDLGIEKMLQYNLLIGVLSFLPIYIVGLIFALKAFFQK